MTRAAWLVLPAVVLLLLPVPASAGTGTTRPPLALSATPARLSLDGAGSATIRVANPSRSAVGVDAERAGFSLDLRGQPRVARSAGRAATSWLAVRPARFVLGAGASRSLIISARLPPGVEPGDHDALVLLTTRPRSGLGVAVRMRIGVVVVVRAPGRVVRRLALGGLRARPARGARVLELWLANRGNVTETLTRGRVRVILTRGPATAGLSAPARILRPRTSGIVELPYRGGLRGWVTARASIVTPGQPVVRRSFRVRL